MYLRNCGVDWHRKGLGSVAGFQSGLEGVFQGSSGSSTSVFKYELTGNVLFLEIFIATSQKILLVEGDGWNYSAESRASQARLKIYSTANTSE